MAVSVYSFAIIHCLKQGTSEDCVEIDTRLGRDGKWNDSPCSKENLYYICGPKRKFTVPYLIAAQI